MGLLKDLFNVAVKAANEYAKQKEEQQKYHKEEESHYNREERKAASYTSTNTTNSTNYEDEFVPPVDWNEYFAEILRTEFPQYVVKRDVPVTDLTGFTADTFKLYKTRPYQTYKAEWGQPYTFVLHRGTVPVGVVMLGAGQSHDQNVKYLIARMYAKKLGMPYINFYTQMRNERSYVIQRIKDLMLGH